MLNSMNSLILMKTQMLSK